jgi:hypothetical protein
LVTQSTVGCGKTQVVHLVPVALVPVAHLAPPAQAARAAAQVVHLLPVALVPVAHLAPPAQAARAAA